ncbi:protein-L-isoaspartate O-methyltransferase [Lentibacter algarum]|uniref:protein-L-isoaspartate O-methyltransferase family protein n=1 Tax=Lentibacter algarum TaxID=576131 RepID=UPI001C074810|nr:protein-L-isoaspartate O-methyltransferase [Lentibacter algarum]MBU2981978.1 protein-L-isoaspartate O-methyltransferase [Lentibacter algarum]
MTDFAQRRTMMVDNQVRPSDVTKYPIIEALLTVEREKFVPDALREAAYLGEYLPLAKGRVLLEPRNFAKMLDALEIGRTDLVLDLGIGFGYSSAVIARMAEAVIGVEDDETLAGEAEAALAGAGADNVVVETGALTAGAPQHGPYDVICIQGGVEELPAAIADQLKEGGRIACIFMDGNVGTVRIGHKVGGDISWRFAFNASAPVLSGFERSKEFSL